MYIFTSLLVYAVSLCFGHYCFSLGVIHCCLLSFHFFDFAKCVSWCHFFLLIFLAVHAVVSVLSFATLCVDVYIFIKQVIKHWVLVRKRQLEYQHVFRSFTMLTIYCSLFVAVPIATNFSPKYICMCMCVCKNRLMNVRRAVCGVKINNGTFKPGNFLSIRSPAIPFLPSANKRKYLEQCLLVCLFF